MAVQFLHSFVLTYISIYIQMTEVQFLHSFVLTYTSVYTYLNDGGAISSFMCFNIYLYIRDADFPLFSVFFRYFWPDPKNTCMLIFSIFSYFICLFLNCLSLLVFIFYEIARTHRFFSYFCKSPVASLLFMHI